MDPVALLALFKDIVGIAILPASLFAYKMYTELSALKDGQKSIKESSSKGHEQVIQALKETQDLIRISERDNRLEHKELADTIHEIDKNNTREHAILSNGGKL